MTQVKAPLRQGLHAAQMEYHVAFDSPPDLDLVESLLLERDPSAIVDLEPHSAPVLRVSSVLPRDLLQVLLQAAGYQVGPDRIRAVPSICCGGCSG